MRRQVLGAGTISYEIEGEADQVGALDPKKLRERGWPEEVVENYIRLTQEVVGGS